MTRRVAIGMAAATLLGACGPQVELKAEPQASEASRAGYLADPEILAVDLGPNGAPLVRGLAQPRGRVRATLPSGEAYGATADDQGRFALELPRATAPQFVSVSAQEGDRSTPAEGWLFVPAGDPRYAALLRAGAASYSLSPAASLIGAVDTDGAGGAGVSGRATANAEVRVFVDGAVAAQVNADRGGRFAVRLDRLSPGVHRLRVASQGVSVERIVDLAPPAQPAGRFTATRLAEAWRVDWTLPGGGLQSTFVFVPGARP